MYKFLVLGTVQRLDFPTDKVWRKGMYWGRAVTKLSAFHVTCYYLFIYYPFRSLLTFKGSHHLSYSFMYTCIYNEGICGYTKYLLDISPKSIKSSSRQILSDLGIPYQLPATFHRSVLWGLCKWMQHLLIRLSLRWPDERWSRPGSVSRHRGHDLGLESLWPAMAFLQAPPLGGSRRRILIQLVACRPWRREVLLK